MRRAALLLALGLSACGGTLVETPALPDAGTAGDGGHSGGRDGGDPCLTPSALAWLEALPLDVTLQPGNKTLVFVRAHYANGCVKDFTDQVTFSSDTPSVVRVVAVGASGAPALEALALGSAMVTAQTSDDRVSSPIEVTVTSGGSTWADAGDPCATPSALDKIVATPATMSLQVGGTSSLLVRAHRVNGCVEDVTASATYSVSPSAVARVVPVTGGKAVEGLAAGSATVTVNALGGSDTVAVTVTGAPAQDAETRAVWVTRFAYHTDATTGTADVKGIINRAAAAGFNTVFFQVRGIADAYYNSDIVPRKVTGWDPLKVAIDQAHLKGIKLHAYLNALTGWNAALEGATLPANHILKTHPEYACKGADTSAAAPVLDGYVWIAADPGYITHFGQVVDELLTKYPTVDGVHLDRIRSPGSAYCHTEALDAAQGSMTFANFQRQQIGKVVKAAYDQVVAHSTAAHPIMLSASVWGIYKRWSTSCSGAYSEGFTSYYQDSIRWANDGYIDALCPMTYWGIQSGACTDWAANLDYFQDAIAGSGRQLIMGMHAHDSSVVNFSKLRARIDYARQQQVAGTTIFASTYLESVWSDFTDTAQGYPYGPYAEPMDPTPMTHR